MFTPRAPELSQKDFLLLFADLCLIRRDANGNLKVAAGKIDFVSGSVTVSVSYSNTTFINL